MWADTDATMVAVSTAVTAVVMYALAVKWRCMRSSDEAAVTRISGGSREVEEVEVKTRLLLQPLQLRDLTIRNRLIRAAAYAGSGLEEMKICHGEVAEGGAGMTTVAYCATHEDGR